MGNYEIIEYLATLNNDIELDTVSLFGRTAVQILADAGYLSAAENLAKIMQK